MNKIFAYLICFVSLTGQAFAQVIYERTYPNAFPSLKDAIQLSDFSTVSFSNNSTCYFAGWRHISPTGSIKKEEGLCGESTHSLKYKQIATDSVLVSCRVGPLDYPGTNYFQVSLWTPDTVTILVLDTVQYNYWDDNAGAVLYDAFLLVDNHVLYQRGDTIFSKNILTGQIDFLDTFFHITHIYPVKDGLMIFSAGLPPTYFNARIEPVKTWLNLSQHPISFNNMVGLDSFVIGINTEIPTSLHAVNACNENTRDIDLAGYFSQIDSLVVRGDLLIVTGRNGATGNTVQLNTSFQLLDEKSFVYPDITYQWQLSFYPDRLYAWRTDGLAGYKADYRVAYSYLDPNPIKYVDLAFLDITVDSMYFWSTPDGSPLILLLSASIINQSTDTLHSLTMHHRRDPFQLCDPGIYPRHASGLTTPPGDTARVKFSVGLWEGLLDEPFVESYYVQHGNHHLDSNRTNNTFEFVYIYTSTLESVTTSAKAYPNPFKEFIIVDERSESIQCTLFDQTGNRVASGPGHLDDLGKLPTGIYFLQVTSGGAISIQRVVKLE